MDATQAISDSILESEEEENEEESQTNDRGKPLAKSCILGNPYIPEIEMPLFSGNNVSGRDPNICTSGLLAPSVSKQHATISISVYRRRGHHSEVDTEASVWDLGSMNGTRKGRLKLTPNVRYALSEGDTLVLGNIPCRYVSSGMESPSSLGDTGTPSCRHSEANARSSDSSNYKRDDDVDAGSKIISSGTKTKTTPVKGDCLPFGQTPIHSQGTLVQESDSDSEGERGRRGDRKQKIIVSDSDSHKSSLSSSAFLSPPVKVVPDSEDESPTTPSSSSRNESNRRVSFSLEKTDVDLGQQSLSKNKTPVFVGNAEEEVEGAADGEESGMNGKREISKNLREDDDSLGPPSEISRDAIPEFNSDSDTDVEGGEEEVVPAGQSDQPSNTVLSHMDSDTDVDEDVLDKVPTTLPSTDEMAKRSGVSSGIQREGITMDSDTDVEDDAVASVVSKATLPQGAHIADSLPPVQSGDFNLDSDTDVDEEEDGGTEAKSENPKQDETLSDKSDKPTPAAPHNSHPHSNPCDKSEGDHSNASSESDTDSEEDPPAAIAAAAATADSSATSAAAPGASEPGSDPETDVDEPAVPQTGDEGGPADFRMESDTDVEDEVGQIPHSQREYTPGSSVPVSQNCSTPVQLSEGQVEQMETQDFTSPTSGELPSSIGPVVMPSCSDSQEDEDYAVAETQSFIIQTKVCHKGLNPNSACEAESCAVKPEDQSARGDSFQSGSSDSSHSQSDPRALAMENTQAYVPVDGCINSEDTQAYAESTSAENDPNSEATQPYIQDVEPARCSEMSKKEGCVDLAFEATQAYISVPYDDGGSDVPEEDESVVSSTLAMAETQPMSSSVEACRAVCSPEPVKTGVSDEAQEHREKLISAAQSLAETQPMNRSDDEESDAEGLSSKPAEEQKHPRTSSALCLAETQPICMSDDEESSGQGLSAESLRPAEVETQPVPSSTSTLAETQPSQRVSAAETQPMDSCEDDENNAEDSEVMLPRKRKAKQLHIDEEESQQHKNSGNASEEEEDSMPSLRKRKAKPSQLEDETQSLVGSQVSAAAADEAPPSAACEVEESSQDIIPTRKRKAKPSDIEDEQTQPLISSEASVLITSEDGGTEPMAACEDEGALQEEETKAPPLTAAGGSGVGAQIEGRDGKSDGDESVACPRKRRAKQLHLEEERTQSVTVSVSDGTKVSLSTKERREQTKSEDEDNQKEVQVTNQRTTGRRNTRKQEEDNEAEKNNSNKNEGQIEDRGDGKLSADSRERSHVKTEGEESINEGTSKRKERIQETQPGSEIKEQKEPNSEKTKINQDEKTEKEEEKQEHQAGLEKTESQANKGEAENPKGSVKGRRAARRTKAAAPPEQNCSEDFPARRTRSRSNSSNSVSSERSVSTINGNTQENKGRGRGRGAKRSSEPPQTAAVRSSRRRTTAAAAEQDTEAQASSELSSTGTGSQNRGRPQRRGRKTSSQPDVVTAGEQKPSRSSTRVLQQDDKKRTDTSLIGTSRGQRRVTANVSDTSVLSNDGLQSNQEKASADLKSPMPKRSTRDRGSKAIKTEHVEEAEAPTASDGDEARSTRKTRSSETKTQRDKVQKPTEPGGREEQKEEIPADVQGRRTSRGSGSQVKGSEESFTKKEAEDGKKMSTGASGRRARGRTMPVQRNKTQEPQGTPTSGCSMEQDGDEEESEVPTMTPSRKRRVSSNSSPVAKTARSSSASPATVGRLRAGNSAYKVLFTGVVDESGERSSPRLGGAMAGGISDMTCSVTDKVRRTVKFSCAVAKGVPVVTTQWSEKSGKAGSFLPPHAFMVKDPEQEKKFNFSSQESSRTASNQPLSQGYEIHVTKSVKPEPVHMKDIITCSGAKFLPKMPTAHKPRTVVVSCEEDSRSCGPAMSASLPVVTAEFILTGISQQRVDFQTHALSPSATNVQPAEGRGRSRKKT